MSPIPSDDLRNIITDPMGTEKLVGAAKQLGEELKNMGLTTSQIRALFGEVRKIEALWESATSENTAPRQSALHRLILLKPKMAYRAKRESGRAVQELANILESALDFVIQEKTSTSQDAHFKRFVEFFEAILAYHKFFGGR